MARTLCFGGMPKITQGGGCAAHFTGGEGGFWPMNSRNSCKELLQKITGNILAKVRAPGDVHALPLAKNCEIRTAVST